MAVTAAEVATNLPVAATTAATNHRLAEAGVVHLTHGVPREFLRVAVTAAEVTTNLRPEEIMAATSHLLAAADGCAESGEVETDCRLLRTAREAGL